MSIPVKFKAQVLGMPESMLGYMASWDEFWHDLGLDPWTARTWPG